MKIVKHVYMLQINTKINSSFFIKKNCETCNNLNIMYNSSIIIFNCSLYFLYALIHFN